MYGILGSNLIGFNVYKKNRKLVVRILIFWSQVWSLVHMDEKNERK
jgi:hypothetical protein